MSIVTIKNKYQIVIPAKVRKEAGVGIGDLLEAGYEKGKITLTPKSLIDRDIEVSFEDFRKGRKYGPFNTAREMEISLKKEIKKIRMGRSRRTHQ